MLGFIFIILMLINIFLAWQTLKVFNKVKDDYGNLKYDLEKVVSEVNKNNDLIKEDIDALSDKISRLDTVLYDNITSGKAVKSHLGATTSSKGVNARSKRGK